MLVNFNGEIFDDSELEMHLDNRAFKYGDGVFETIKYANGKLLFWEDHYFRLMSAMRIIRMEIPMSFSPEYLENQILELVKSKHQEKLTCRIRLSVFREDGGRYAPKANGVEWLVETSELPYSTFVLNEVGLTMDVFKDHLKPKGLLSNLKSINCLIYTVAGVFAKENELDDVALINDDKHIVEAISSNVFLIKENKLITPTTETGCVRGVMRKNIVKIAQKAGFEIVEETFSPFEIQRADEMFLTNAINGIQWVGQFKKKSFGNTKTKEILDLLNNAIA